MKKYLFAILKGILAGASIGLGGFLFVIVTTFVKGQIGLILGALLFPVGLLLVCSFSLFLYTGKIGVVFEGRQEKDFYVSLPLMFIGNIIGSLLIGYLCYFIFRNNNDIYARINAVCEARFQFNNYQGYLSCFLKSLFCGLFVYLAVKAFAFDRLKPVGIALLFFFIFTFVYLGLEHCIANAYYFSFANKWDNPNAYIDMALCVLGNSLGTIPGVLLLKLTKK